MDNLESVRESVPEDLQGAVEQLLVAASKDLREVIIACSVPNWFNLEIIRTLQAIVGVGGDPAEFQRDILDYAFVRPYHGLGFVIHENVRSILRQIIEADFKQLLALHEGMFHFFEEKIRGASEAEKRHYVREKGYHACELGVNYLEENNFETAQSWLFRAIDNYKAAQDQQNVIETLRWLGQVHLHQKDFAQAEVTYGEAAELAESLGDIKKTCDLFEELGSSLAVENAWDAAIKTYQKRADLEIPGEVDEARRSRIEGLAALWAGKADWHRLNSEWQQAKHAYGKAEYLYYTQGDTVSSQQMRENIAAVEREARQSYTISGTTIGAVGPGAVASLALSTRTPKENKDMFQRLRIFISSTVNDLKPERDAVEKAIAELHFETVRSEKVGSQSISPREVCRIMAQECDIYLGILGERHGYTLPEGRSVTEFEFDTARETDKPILLYRKEVHEEKLEPEQKAFIERVSGFEKGYFLRNFTDLDVPDQLVQWVQEDIQSLLAGAFRDRMPGPQLRPGPPSGRRVLIASLGRSPGTVTGLYHALTHSGTPVDAVRTVSTSEFQVQRAVKVVRDDLKDQGLEDYADVCIGSTDVTNDRDAQEFKSAFAHLLAEAREAGDEVAIGIAGGRTVMGALLTIVAQMEAPEGSYFYQLSVPDAIEEDGRFPQFSRLNPDRQREVLRPMAYFIDQCHLVKVSFARISES